MVPGPFSRARGRSLEAGGLSLVPAAKEHLAAALAIVAAAPAAGVHVGARLAGARDPRHPEGDLWTLLDGPVVAGMVLRSRGTAWVFAEGVAADERAALLVAQLLARTAAGSEVVYGPEDQVRRVSAACGARGLVPVEVRRQEMMWSAAPAWPAGRGAPDEVAWRAAEENDLRWILDAHGRMCREDLGVDQVARNPSGYHAYFTELIRRRRSFVAGRAGVLLAKAEVPLASAEAWLVEGVFTEPSWRGRGLATLLVVEIGRLARAEGRGLCLYVHRRNTGALSVYRRIGFETVTPWTTAILGLDAPRSGGPAEW